MASSVAQSSPSCFQDPSLTDGTSEPPTNTPREVSTKREFDFIELPPRDFFCPVSFDLLLEPEQTKCCGHHLSLEVTTRLQREGKACPMCKSEAWSADLDKYHRRKVHQVRVRCWYKESGCAWEGDMNGFKRHSGSCEKRPWECEYCGLKCTYGEGEVKHWGVCDKFPEPCPNGCEVGSVERCAMEQHRSVCPLEPVACEMREFGCSVVVPRREMATHMKESEIQHLTSMTALNLRLTRQLQHDSAKMEQMITEQRKELEVQKKEMAALLKKTEAEIQAKQKVEHNMQYAVSGMHVVLDIPGAFSTDKPLYSEPFYSYHHGYKFRLGVVIIPPGFGKNHTLADIRRQQLCESVHSVVNLPPIIETGYDVGLCKVGEDNSCSYITNNMIGAVFHLVNGEYDQQLSWPVKVNVQLELLNQTRDHYHLMKTKNLTFTKEKGSEDDAPLFKFDTQDYHIMHDRSVVYFLNSCLKFRMIICIT